MAEFREDGSSAKIARPRILGAYPRTRLFDRLDAHLKSPAVWIAAAAGAGKTTLAASYLAEKGIPTLWYQIDEGDNDIATFFYYMGLAASKNSPSGKPLPLLTPEYLLGIPTFTMRYFENLYTRLMPPFAVVFDNCQLLSPESPFHQILRSGIELLPEGGYILCISRANPPAALARLHANETLRLLDAEELRFTYEESRELLRMKGFGTLAESTIRYIHQKTDGWAAGMMMMLQQTDAETLNTRVSAGFIPEDVFDYFSHELFIHTAPEIRNFLLKTSFLPKMTASMAGRISGMDQAGDILVGLYRSNFFTHRDIQKEPFYQYHPLFREFLQSNLHHFIKPEEISSVRREAAQILEASNQIEDAADLLLGAGDFETLAPLILSHAPDFVQQGRSDTLEGWLKAFPQPLTGQVPWIPYWLGVARSYKSPKEAYFCFDHAFQMFENIQDTTGMFLSWSGAVNTILLLEDDYTALDPWVAWLDDQVRKEIAYPSAMVEAHVAASMLGALVWRFPRRPDILEWMNRVEKLTAEIEDAGLSLQIFFHQSSSYYCSGDFDALQTLSRKMSASISGSDSSPLFAIYSLVAHAATHAAMYSNCAQALNLVRSAHAMAAETGVHLLDSLLDSVGVLLALNAGDDFSVKEYLDRMALSAERGTACSLGRYSLYRAWRDFLTGDFISSAPVMEKTIQVAVRFGAPYNTQLCHHLLSLIRYAENRHETALNQIHAAQALIPSGRAGYYYDYLYRLTEAEIHLAMGQTEAALSFLKTGMAIGRLRGYKTLVFHWRPQAMARLCAVALEHGIEADYILELIRALDLPSDAVPAHMENWPWPVRIYTLGKFEIHRNSVPVQFPRKAQKKTLQLLMAVISLGGKNIRNDRLKDLLWPESDGDKAQSAFTSALSRLRTLLGTDRAVLVQEGQVSLNSALCWVDASAFESLANQVISDDSGNGTEASARALGLYGGAFLAGEEAAPWMLPAREALMKKYCRVVLAVGSRLEAGGSQDQAAACYRKALDTDTLADEEIYRRLMQHYCDKDQPGNVAEVYMRLSRLMAATYGVRPSAKTESLYRRLRE